MRTVLLILLFFSIQIITSQNHKTIDSIVDTYPKSFKSIEVFANRIAYDFKTDLEKTRAAYYWIANNVSYDYKSLRKKSKNNKINSKSKTDYEAKLYAFNRKIAKKTLQKKSAVCEGYAQLLNETLRDMGINSAVVTGFAKQFPNEIGRVRRNSNHAWNAVKIEEDWFLIDATWSTGNTEYNSNFFNFSDTYFLISPNAMILSHFPDDKQWQLLKRPVSKIDFFNYPIYYTAYHKSGLKLQTNFYGEIITKTDSIIQLSFSEIDSRKTYYYSFEKGKSDEIKFKEIGKHFIALIPYQYKRRKNLIITDGQLALVKFKIKLIKNP